MAKFIIFLLSIFIITCSEIKTEKTILIDKNYKIYVQIHHPLIIKRMVEREIEFYDQENLYSQNEINLIVKLLRIGENDFFISAIDIIAIISLESNWKYKARKLNENGTIDYGLTQQNSCCILDRYYQAADILTKYNIDYNISNRKDIALNIISAFIFLDEIRNYLIKNNKFTKFRFITAYNTGYGKIYKKKLKRAIRYYKSFIQIRRRIMLSNYLR